MEKKRWSWERREREGEGGRGREREGEGGRGREREGEGGRGREREGGREGGEHTLLTGVNELRVKKRGEGEGELEFEEEKECFKTRSTSAQTRPLV